MSLSVQIRNKFKICIFLALWGCLLWSQDIKNWIIKKVPAERFLDHHNSKNNQLQNRRKIYIHYDTFWAQGSSILIPFMLCKNLVWGGLGLIFSDKEYKAIINARFSVWKEYKVSLTKQEYRVQLSLTHKVYTVQLSEHSLHSAAVNKKKVQLSKKRVQG